MYKENISHEDSTLTYLLGFLTAKQWKSAIKEAPFTALIWALIDQQDKTYNDGKPRLRNEVRELLEE